MVSSYGIWKAAVIAHFERQSLPGKAVRTVSITAEILTRFCTYRAVTAILHCSVKFHLKRFNPDYIITAAAPQIYNKKYTQKLKVSQNLKYNNCCFTNIQHEIHTEIKGLPKSKL
jgi:hypothetical protein